MSSNVKFTENIKFSIFRDWHPCIDVQKFLQHDFFCLLPSLRGRSNLEKFRKSLEKLNFLSFGQHPCMVI